nr:O-fucosyltransferase 37 [Tanacetum cinerariifolium]
MGVPRPPMTPPGFVHVYQMVSSYANGYSDTRIARRSCVIANENKRFLVVVGLGGLSEIRTQIVDAVVIARILEASFVFPVFVKN